MYDSPNGLLGGLESLSAALVAAARCADGASKVGSLQGWTRVGLSMRAQLTRSM